MKRSLGQFQSGQQQQGVGRTSTSKSQSSGSSSKKQKDDLDDEEDYMSMSFLEEAEPSKKEMTYSQRRKKEMEESRKKGQTKSIKEREAEQREIGLKTDIMKEDNVGFTMLAKMGFKKGMTLGKPAAEEDGRTRLLEPLPVIMKTEKTGIGLATHHNDKLREATSNSTILTEDEYRQTTQRRVEERRIHGELTRARHTIQTMDETRGISRHELWPDIVVPKRLFDDIETRAGSHVVADAGGLSEFDHEVREEVWVRTVVEEVEEDTETQVKEKKGEKGLFENSVNDAQQEMDEELSEFQKMETKDKLKVVIGYLRSEHYYCLWCGDRFANNEEMSRLCPGDTRDAHDE
ncbi:G patch domain-containing protein 11 [Blyttiomyces sp. JEL0837]|nr:G patch domain-containing protein 11 [Blyttiomyces sp. JEL0837]